jgi:glycosyltransferase involved in cell wall biosynthesis
LKAVAQLQQPFVLHIGGDGALINTYKKFATDNGIVNNCRFYGSIPPSEVPSFMSKLHFFVCSSRYETFGVALVEAMASGLPIVATRCGGPEELVSATTGILVAVSDAKDMLLKIEWMIQNRKVFEDVELQKHASCFSGNHIAQLLEELYNTLSKVKESNHRL